ncbi:protein NO VEIN domain-containing protein [Desulfoluna butyratoxydans]|uniref:Restriction endonuclease type ii-like n=1 Tax=Desulfoluna butyratoxydans TaxID=231438 RepID=A0A4V6ILY2_9BACT|nr:DUF3883 domain-containing protein [Desulfoluna butyratoxydans]VFQ46898.1 restriction endonuclease type ii-like [Desulfoluna butyratoxydans]
MKDFANVWLLFEKSDKTRISKGIDGYQDKTGTVYNYDSLVPNHKNLKSDDLVILRKEDKIIGVGGIGSITEQDTMKEHRRCPMCRSTDIRERKTKKPKWKCGKCAYEFPTPEKTMQKVRSFTAEILDFSQLSAPPSVLDVKSCASHGSGASSQLSIIKLDSHKIKSLLEGFELSPSPRNTKKSSLGQGFGLSSVERKAVELQAMKIARKVYEDKGWKVVDKSLSQPFDLLATRNNKRRFIEVKGTTGEGKSVILTHGEVNHAKSFDRESVLVVVANIHLEKTGDNWTASGGEISTHLDPWLISLSDLQATQFKYIIR